MSTPMEDEIKCWAAGALEQGAYQVLWLPRVCRTGFFTALG